MDWPSIFSDPQARDAYLGYLKTAGNAVPQALTMGNPYAARLSDKARGFLGDAASSAWQAFTLPGRALTGQIGRPDEMPPSEAVGEAMNFAGNVTLGGLGTRGSAAMGAMDPNALTVSGLKVYHGSPKAGLTELLPSERGPLGPGVYATPNMNVARQYAGPDGHMYTMETGDIFNGLGRHGNVPADVSHYAVYKEETKRILDAAPAKARDELKSKLERLGPDEGYLVYWEMRRMFGDEGAQQILKDAGFSGMSGFVDGPEVVMFGNVRPNKVKE